MILSANSLIEVQDLKVWFPIKRFLREPIFVKAVDGVSFNIARGETLAVVGESGSGKTTLG
ncbi:MAG: ATP-binding cassette domain-containing protein, partial [Crenarchaeota archaeon]|nr:ATP-binding cassette domain-containing protein [Thermoproteota archaeon]